jgi:hypothetical protein
MLAVLLRVCFFLDDDAVRQGRGEGWEEEEAGKETVRMDDSPKGL